MCGRGGSSEACRLTWGRPDIKGGHMNETFESIIALDEQMYDATCKITQVNRRLGGEVVSVEVEAITINDMPAALFSKETVLEAESQMRHNWRALGDIQCRSLPDDEDEEEGDYTGGNAQGGQPIVVKVYIGNQEFKGRWMKYTRGGKRYEQ